jgi:hypothetical protein
MLGYLALTLTYLGYVDQARSCIDRALSEARQLEHTFTLVLVLQVSIPRQSRGLYVVSRSKRLSGALTRPRLMLSRLKAARGGR